MIKIMCDYSDTIDGFDSTTDVNTVDGFDSIESIHNIDFINSHGKSSTFPGSWVILDQSRERV